MSRVKVWLHVCGCGKGVVGMVSSWQTWKPLCASRAQLYGWFGVDRRAANIKHDIIEFGAMWFSL